VSGTWLQAFRSASAALAAIVLAAVVGIGAADDDDVVKELRKRHLELPVDGLKRGALRDTFSEMRGGTRRHQALDLLAPRNTPVLAVDDGKVAKLFRSKPGGLTIYQFDPTSTYAYYYAHLERYADGLKDGGRAVRSSATLARRATRRPTHRTCTSPSSGSPTPTAGGTALPSTLIQS